MKSNCIQDRERLVLHRLAGQVAELAARTIEKEKRDIWYQQYAGWNGSRVDRSVKQLQDFAKVYLDPGESRTVELSA